MRSNVSKDFKRIGMYAKLFDDDNIAIFCRRNKNGKLLRRATDTNELKFHHFHSSKANLRITRLP